MAAQDTFHQAAKLTDGFSGRELTKLMSYIQSAVYGSASSVDGNGKGTLTLSSATMMDLIRKKASEHKHKDEFRALSKGNGVVNPVLSHSSLSTSAKASNGSVAFS